MVPFPFVRRMIAAGLVVGCSTGVRAADGQPDPSFDLDGMQTIGFDLAPEDTWSYANADVADAMVLGPGRVYLVGRALRNADDSAIGITRLRYDGTIDTAFGDGGRVVLDVASGRNVVYDAALQPDGKLLLAAGIREKGMQQIRALVCRLWPSGQRDTTFGETTFPGCRAFDTVEATSTLLVQPDGRIVLALRHYVGDTDIGARLLRLLPDGTTDESFGTAGEVRLGGNLNSEFVSLARMPDGDLVGAGYVWGFDNVESEADVLLFRVDQDGVPDPAFGPNGTKVIAIDAGSEFYRRRESASAVRALPDGSLIVTGSAASDSNPEAPSSKSYRPFVFKLDPQGALDPSFGGGLQLFDPCVVACSSNAKDAVVYPDGRVAVAGFNSDIVSNASEFAITRFESDGSLDLTFGDAGTGTVEIDFAQVDGVDSDDRAYRMAFDGSRLLLAGWTSVPPAGPNQLVGTDFAIARLDHGLDQMFVVSPTVVGPGALSPATAQDVLHSDHIDFEVMPEDGHMLAAIDGCDGTLYDTVYTTGATTADCTVTAVFKPVALFRDGFDEQ